MSSGFSSLVVLDFYIKNATYFGHGSSICMSSYLCVSEGMI